MSRYKVFIEEGIPARLTEEHTIMNDFLKLKHDASTNKEITPNEGIPTGITEEHTIMNDFLKLKHDASTNKEITPNEGIPTRSTKEHDSLNDYPTVIYEDLDKNKSVTPTDIKQQFSRLVCL